MVVVVVVVVVAVVVVVVVVVVVGQGLVLHLSATIARFGGHCSPPFLAF